ncbi:tripartite tricarboxylate transporter substrate binding protein [Bordetella sp. BOR01]|uniref:Bug family tripartite tricarboxylate transporter substrate binding protein n=1 Tax=Bordetella sp. BOR01 TaxID=2854779 RepID=UPI001C44769E|nr:tripartite tricarboxylate transporter substrate binding protein [Bordetella sp. BOR01]MBV7483683.1 tripartite tricarboxylate transporter substrate binding protein [Bordetella sp. BOR01]
MVRNVAYAAIVFAITAISGLTQAGEAGDYPNHAVKISVPYGAGGGIDSISRIVGQKLAEMWHQPVVIENRPGAGAIIGTQAVVNAPPDGYTLLMTAGTLAVSPTAYSDLPYDVVKDLAPITLVGSSPYILAVRASLPAQNVQELINLAKEKPQALNFGSPGLGTLSHLGFELLQFRTGTRSTIIHYKGSPAALNALLAGQIDMVLDTPAALMPHIQGGKVRALAVTDARRSASLPDTPTIMQAGVPDYEVNIWFGLMAPGGTPPAVLDRIHADTVSALADPDVRKRFEAQGMEPQTLSRRQFADLINTDVKKWANVVRQAGIEFQ